MKRRSNTPGAARLVDHRRHPGAGGDAPQRALRAAAVDHERAAEGAGQLGDLWVAEVGAHVRVVGAVAARGVEVDAVVAAAHHVLEHPVGEAGGEGAVRRCRGTSG